MNVLLLRYLPSAGPRALLRAPVGWCVHLDFGALNLVHVSFGAAQLGSSLVLISLVPSYSPCKEGWQTVPKAVGGSSMHDWIL